MEGTFITQAITVAVVLSACLLVVGAVVLFRYALAYLKANAGEKQFNLLAYYAELIVRGLEQAGLTLHWDGEQKKNIAMSVLMNFCEERGIPFDPDLLDNLVESAVGIMNAELGKFLKPEAAAG